VYYAKLLDGSLISNWWLWFAPTRYHAFNMRSMTSIGHISQYYFSPPVSKLRRVGSSPEFTALWTCYSLPFSNCTQSSRQLNSVMCEYTCTFITFKHLCRQFSGPRVQGTCLSLSLIYNIGVASNKVNTAVYNTVALVQLSRPDVPFWQAHRSEKHLINFMIPALLLDLGTLKQSVMTLRISSSGLQFVFKTLLQLLCVYKLVCL
jgi:hypothetical protein